MLVLRHTGFKTFLSWRKKCVKAMQRDTRVALAKQLPYIILTNNDTGVSAKHTQF